MNPHLLHCKEDSLPPSEKIKDDKLFSDEEEPENYNAPLIPMGKEENDEESSKGDVVGENEDQRQNNDQSGEEESSSSENQSEKDTKENWEKMRSEAMQKYKENLEKEMS